MNNFKERVFNMLLGGKITIHFEDENDYFSFFEKLESLGCSFDRAPDSDILTADCEYLHNANKNA